jgi:hypothetical protein
MLAVNHNMVGIHYFFFVNRLLVIDDFYMISESQTFSIITCGRGNMVYIWVNALHNNIITYFFDANQRIFD